jgi:predicted PurR-regulated permease PerM
MTTTTTTWRSSDLLRAFAFFFALYIAIRFLWVVRSIILVVTLAALFGVTLAHGVDVLERWKIKRAFGTVLILLLVFGVIIGAGAMVLPTLQDQSSDIFKRFPAAVKQFEQKLRRKPLANAALSATTGSTQSQQPPANTQSTPAATNEKPSGPNAQKPSGSDAKPQPQSADALSGILHEHAQSLSKMLFPFLTNSLAALAGLLVIIFLAAYFASEPHVYRDGLLRLVPPAKRDAADELFREIASLLRQWLLARLLAMVAVGTITGVGLALLGVPAAAALGLLAGLMEFVPFIGPIVSAVPAVGMALVDSPQTAIYVVILFIVIQQLEGNLITPLLMKNRLDVPPAVTIIAVSALGVVFGILGMLIAEPLSAVIILVTNRLYVERMEKALVAPAAT